MVSWTDVTDERAGAAPVAPAGQYTSLIERALAFVRGRGGSCHEDLLIAHVFGNMGHVKMWRPLLRQALASCDDLSLRADSVWCVREMESIGGETGHHILREFVAIDVETTGARPATQRIIEVGAVRFEDGREVGRFESLVNPGRALPRFIVELTGIRDIDLATAPPFATIAEDLLAFIGSSVVAGHNVKFDIGFIDAELRRVGEQALPNERIDTVGLATRLIPGLRKPSLERVAKTLGVQGRSLHRAAVDAEICGKVALRLVESAKLAGVSDIDLVKALANSVGPRPKDKLSRTRTILDRSLLEGIPRAPGVYIMRDRYDHIIYVGKAKNLRERVGSYYSQPVGYTRKMDGLVEHLAAIETVVVGSELEALLLESQLIRRYQPRYNTALRASERYPFIRLDVSNPWPRLTLTKDRKDDGAAYFGPFRNTSGARRTVEYLNDTLPLRTCPRSFRDARSYGSPCLRLDLGKCLGPCVGRASVDAYRAIVHDVAAFLDGDDTVLVERLQQSLTEAAGKLDFERATRLRNDLRTALQVSAIQRQSTEAARRHTLLAVQPGTTADERVVMLVVKGRRWAQFASPVTDAPGLSARLAKAWDRYEANGLPLLDHEIVDEAAILNRWLGQRDDHPAIVPIPDALAKGPGSWLVLATAALAPSIEDLLSEPVVTTTDEPSDDGDAGAAEDLVTEP